MAEILDGLAMCATGILRIHVPHNGTSILICPQRHELQLADAWCTPVFGRALNSGHNGKFYDSNIPTPSLS